MNKPTVIELEDRIDQINQTTFDKFGRETFEAKNRLLLIEYLYYKIFCEPDGSFDKYRTPEDFCFAASQDLIPKFNSIAFGIIIETESGNYHAGFSMYRTLLETMLLLRLFRIDPISARAYIVDKKSFDFGDMKKAIRDDELKFMGKFFGMATAILHPNYAENHGIYRHHPISGVAIALSPAFDQKLAEEVFSGLPFFIKNAVEAILEVFPEILSDPDVMREVKKFSEIQLPT